MILTNSLLKTRPYRYYLLLYDFIHHRQFELTHSGNKVSFEYMGDARKFYHPAEFTTYHDVYDALTWMKTAEIFFKKEKQIYPINVLNMPEDYEHGSRSEFYHIFIGVALIYKFLNPDQTVTSKDVLKTVSRLGDRKIVVSTKKVMEMDVNVSPTTLKIITSPMFSPLLKDEIRYACTFVNGKKVSGNITQLNSKDKYAIKLVIGQNRGITTNDIKLYEQVKGNFREIKLDHRSDS